MKAYEFGAGRARCVILITNEVELKRIYEFTLEIMKCINFSWKRIRLMSHKKEHL